MSMKTLQPLSLSASQPASRVERNPLTPDLDLPNTRRPPMNEIHPTCSNGLSRANGIH